jgi:pimeloyl-ACP methyl ester carboxylesterase
LRAGADAQAFESLLAGAGDDDNSRPSGRPAAPAAAVGIGSQSTAADEAEDEETSSLLPPVLPLHRGAERFAWAAPDGTLLEVIQRQGVPQGDDAAAGGPGAVAVERCGRARSRGRGKPPCFGAGRRASCPCLKARVITRPRLTSPLLRRSATPHPPQTRAPRQHSSHPLPPPHPTPPRRPPLVFIHGLFRGAWCFDEALMPALSSAGYDCYALSLRGQGASRLGRGISRVAAARGGVPLAVNVADIAAFVASLPGPPPVLVGHSLGGTFVQEYLALLGSQQHALRQRRRRAGGVESEDALGADEEAAAAEGGRGGAPDMPPLPPLTGAVALASACAGTIMAFGDFVRDVGMREFLFQVGCWGRGGFGILFSC